MKSSQSHLEYDKHPVINNKMVFIKSSISFHQIKPSLSSHSSLRPDCCILSCHLINSNSGGAQARRGLGRAQPWRALRSTTHPWSDGQHSCWWTCALKPLRKVTPLWRTKTQHDLKTVPERKKQGKWKGLDDSEAMEELYYSVSEQMIWFQPA